MYPNSTHRKRMGAPQKFRLTVVDRARPDHTSQSERWSDTANGPWRGTQRSYSSTADRGSHWSANPVSTLPTTGCHRVGLRLPYASELQRDSRANPPTKGGMAVTGEADGRFQVLAIDGGGLKGIFAAAALAGLGSDYDSRLTDHFDLIVGTSTGGIVALGLAAGLSAQQIVDFYLQHQDEIFPRRLLPRLRRVWSTYDPAPLVECLAEAFGTMTLGESPIRLAIPSFDLTSNDVYLFRTPHFERLLRDKKERLVDVARATSAAPTFFPALDLRGVRLIDGGVWANNPSLVGVVEAAECCGGELGQIHLLNVGTTTELRLLPRKLDTGG